MLSWLQCIACIVLVAVGGCARGRQCCLGNSSQGAAQSVSATLPPSERGVATISVDTPDRPIGLDLPAVYHPLTPIEAQCQAVQGSAIGNMLDDQRRHTSCQQQSCDSCNRMMSCVLSGAAMEARNRNAGTAMELYYTIAGLEAQRDILDQTLQLLDMTTSDLANARKQGLTIPLVSQEFERQRFETERKIVELELNIIRANRELVKLLGMEWGDPSIRIWPKTDLHAAQQQLDVEIEVNRAMSDRPELWALRCLASSDCLDYLPTMRQVVAATHACLGVRAMAGGCMFSRLASQRDDECELAERRQQLRSMVAQREREIRDDVRLAVVTVNGRYDQSVLAKESLLYGDRQVSDLEKARDINRAEPSDVVQAKLKRLESRSKLIESVVAWHIAQVKLQEAEGHLVADCAGYCQPTFEARSAEAAEAK